MKAQTIQIDSTFTSDGEIFPFSPNDTIYGLSISGSIALHSDTSLVRVILTDNSGNTWMVFEAYPMINPVWTFPFNEMADETMYRQILNPGSLRIEILHATLDIDYVRARDEYSENLVVLQALHKEIIEGSKADSINAVIENNDMLWFAHQTPISELAYSDKLSRFGVKYNLKGLDYYSGGIYDDIPGVTGPPDNSMLVENFDWRKRHGADDPDKGDFYYDINSDGWGWLTSVKNQYGYDCDGLCYIYGPLAAIEAVSNLYFNDHINYNLSVQHVLDCDTDGSDEECLRGNATNTNKFIRDHGVFDSIWYPREGLPEECRYDSPPPCSTYYQIKIAGYDGVSNNADSIKEALINHGPLSVLLLHYAGENKNHYMALVGYGKIKAGDIYQIPGQPQINITVDSNSEYIGHLYWILKNSRGTELGDHGYFNHLDEQINIGEPAYYKLPFDDLLCNDDTIIFFDKDKDGYWNWGISEEYELPDGACSKDKDSDDSENRIGPFDLNYHGIPVAPEMKVYMMKSLAKDYIINNSFFSFSANDINAEDNIRIYIENSGNAQLNLKPTGIMGKGKVEIINIPGGSPYYSISEENRPGRSVCMESDSSFFVTFTGQEQGELTKIKISLDENGDIPDFEFILVYNDCQPEHGVVEITGDQTWDSFALKTKDYLILPQATLTITSEVAMAGNSDIFVAPDGKLIIDGGRLTSACSGLWNGIDVWGDPRQPQIIHDQGMVEIKNGGKIEYADTAISTARFINIYHYPSGGIVSCKDAVFKDNTFDVVFYPYTNTHPVTHEIIGNASRFTRTRFETTNDYYDITHSDAETHLKLNEVGGIRFAACTFNNSSTQKEYSRGKGIESNDAGYTINNFCAEDFIPCPGEQPCIFENLDYGIRAFNNNDYFPILVDSSDFIHNRRGMYLSLINHPMVIKNRFDLSDPAGIWINEPIIGLYLDEFTTGYVVEENQFSCSTATSESFGIHLLNNGPAQNEIYYNSFSFLSTGIMAVGDNRMEDTGVGLCIKCNDFTDCIDDISVTPALDENEIPIITDNTGIALWQGEEGNGNDLAAGNTFSEYAEYNYIIDEGCRKIDYTYHNENSTVKKVKPEPTAGNINLIPDEDAYYSEEESCPSHLTGGGITFSQEKLLLTSETELISAYQDTLIAMIDGGNTESLNYEVLTSYPQEALVIRQELIEESPFLSDTVMISAIEKEDVLPGAMIRDVLVQNPQAPKSNDVMNALNQRQDTIPRYMMEEILEGLAVYGEKELLEQQMGQHIAKRDMAWRNLNHYFKGDTSNAGPYSDSLIALYANENRPEARYDLCFMHLSREDSSSLFNALSNIPIEFDLSTGELFIHNQYQDLFGILWDVKTNTTELDSLQIQSLYNLSTPIHSLPANYAFNLLISKDIIGYSEPVYSVELLKSVTTPAQSPQVNESPDRLMVFPNPADSYFIVQYDLSGFTENGVLAISDMNGKKLKQYGLTDMKNQIVINTAGYPSGNYIIHLIGGYKLVSSEKISVIH